MRTSINCHMCGVELHNDTDTYGYHGSELCADCWYEQDEQENGVYYYGAAPHFHDLSRTGSFIGSTVFEDYKATSKRDERGRYWIESRQMWFTPDDEVGGDAGMWEER